MVSLEAVQLPNPRLEELVSSPRISFSADFLDESDFISISPNGVQEEEVAPRREKPRISDPNFEFLSNQAVGSHAKMLTADQLFFEGKLLPFWAMQQAEKLSRISLKSGEDGDEVVVEEGEEERVDEATGRISKEPPALASSRGINWSFLDDDPSPRPPKCTVLWKELLRLKKHQRPNLSSSLSPSSSSSSTSSSSSSMADAAAMDEKKKKKTTKDGDATARTSNNNDNDMKSQVKRIKKGLERTRPASIRIRPMVNVPICTPVSRAGSGSALPPLFPLKKGRV
ncbi:uncharacterized protein LOC116195096 [Punica granatum]|uniref:Uncharacterized protein n=2 Tax=Punica granatum TaxID=22663 RepID=A0A218WBC1_PUNGR|nr:uncharacterized protein LOC116195096 [Punica granatum]OWM69833.1 hypothetical protein CDL15_Pgr025682 [Punica granatum]PKI40761.1 hypothetical protein CRG98_038857 [Punica granatum]